MLHCRALALLALFRVCLAHNNASNNTGANNFKYVDPFIGSIGAGGVFVGATLPFGLAKAVADTSSQNTDAGFALDGSNVTGFSALHDSGTGGKASLGNFPISVQPACQGDTIDGCQFGNELTRAVNYVNDSVKATPGYFALGLENGVDVEMTVTKNTALYSFQFQSNVSSPVFLLDLTDLSGSRQNASINVDPDTGRIMGNGTFLPSFGVGSYMTYFCLDFKGAAIRDNGIWVNGRAGTEPKQLFIDRGYSLWINEAGGWIRFNKPASGTVQARMGASFLSTEQACHNAETEIADWDFDKVKTDAENAWKARLGGVNVQTGGVSDDYLRLFYTSIYHTMISPQNYTGQNYLFPSDKLYFDSYYCIWDSFRTDFPWLTITQPDAMSQMVQSLINTQQLLGWLPDCRMSLCKGYTQGGSNADIVLADAYIKNLSNIDWNDAYKAVTRDAEVEPFDWGVNGRGGVRSWGLHGYIPIDDYDYEGFGIPYHSISRTLEYAYDDFAIAQMAKGLGHQSDYEKYLASSANWLNLYKANQTSYYPNGTSTGNFTGFFQPRYQNGTWAFQSPWACSNLDPIFCSLSSNPTATFESSIWEYQFYVPQDMATLIKTLGGPQTFVRRLDYLHDSQLIGMGNEPSELDCFEYHYAGRPGRSAYRIHSYIPSLFNWTDGGLPGNDDSGAFGSFLAFAMSGLFPIAGQDVYLIIPPFFESVSYTHPQTGKVATITNKNFDKNYQRIYIQNATLNGQSYTKSWVTHDFFYNGGTLELTLGSQESSTWGTAQSDLPPSSGAHDRYTTPPSF